ncbi:hypothetical protein [Streptomyces xanthophaeus]|nr:hypothetical protein [Streptomyces xanthophaeus]
MNHPFQTTISEEELIRRHNETVAAQRAAEQARQTPSQPAPQEG